MTSVHSQISIFLDAARRMRSFTSPRVNGSALYQTLYDSTRASGEERVHATQNVVVASIRRHVQDLAKVDRAFVNPTDWTATASRTGEDCANLFEGAAGMLHSTLLDLEEE